MSLTDQYWALSAMEHATEDAKKKYLQEHQGAKPENHTVKQKGDGGDSEGGGKGGDPKAAFKSLSTYEDAPAGVKGALGRLSKGQVGRKDVASALKVLKKEEAPGWSDEEKAELKTAISHLETVQKAQGTLYDLYRGYEGDDQAVEDGLKALGMGEGEADVVGLHNDV